MSIAGRISELWKNKKVLLYYGCFGVIGLLFVGIVLQKAGVIFANGTPQELREMNTVVFADSFAHGKNLYAVSNLENQIPVPTSMYGFLVPLVLAPFIRLFSFTGLNSLQICQLLTLAVEIAGALFSTGSFIGKQDIICRPLLGWFFFITVIGESMVSAAHFRISGECLCRLY